MNNKMVASASVAVALVVTSCSSSSPAVSTGAFSDQLAVCRTINVLLWALAPSADLLAPAVRASGESVSQ